MTSQDDDMVTVTLRHCDWTAIEQNLRDDADAGDMGKNEALLDAAGDEGEDEDDVESAYRVARFLDAQEPCHANGAATERCAGVIAAALAGGQEPPVPGIFQGWREAGPDVPPRFGGDPADVDY
jgi:hypothetical protein